jgi:alanyl aminopeptidase
MRHNFVPVGLVMLALLLAGCSKNEGLHAYAAASPRSSIPLSMLPRTIVPSRYRLALVIDPGRAGFSGHVEIDAAVIRSQQSYFMHGLDLHVRRAVARLASGAAFSAIYRQVHDSGVAALSFAKPLPKGRVTLLFDYEAPFNTSLSGLYKVVDRGEEYAFTQFENTDARRAFPSFDEPGFKTPFDVSVTAPSADKVIANTPVVSSAPAGNGVTKWVFETTKPLPTYLVAMAVGPLDVVDAGDVPSNQYRNYPLHLRGITARGMGPKLHYALSLTPAIVTALENYYGIGYPFQKLDVLAVPDFAAGAMENAGAVTFREQLLLMDDNAPLEQKRSSLSVQAHELAHQWFGDLVTPRWWDDIWLNESFATWMEYKISQTVRPDQDFAHDTLIGSLGVMRLDELPSARQIHNPVNNPDDIDNAFDDITYSKGGAVLSMFESFVGPEQFRKGIHAYLTKFAYRNATAEDFIRTIGEVTGHPEIAPAFNAFIDQPHIPLMQTKLSCDNDPATLNITENIYRPASIDMAQGMWQVPMCVEAAGTKKCEIVGLVPRDISLGHKCPIEVFPNADGAGYYRFTLAKPQLQEAIRNAAALSDNDRLTFFHNVNAGLRAGRLPAADFYALIRALAPVAGWDLLYSDHRDTFDLTDALHDLRVTGVLAPQGLAAQQAFVRAQFGPRLQQLGLSPKPGEPTSDAMLRAQLAQLLVEEGGDPAVIAPLAKAARVYLESGGRDMSLSPELRQEALRAGVIAEGPAFEDLLIDRMQKSTDEYFIQSAIYALAGAQDEAALSRVLAMSLTPQIRTGDLRYVQRYFSAEPAAKRALWNWFKANFGALEKRLSRYGMGSTPDIQTFGCDLADKSDLHAFFAPKVNELEGVPRVLKENEERIDRCMAFKAAKGAEVNAAVIAAR